MFAVRPGLFSCKEEVRVDHWCNQSFFRFVSSRKQMKAVTVVRYLLPFLLLTILCGTSHEFTHHFAGAAICGCFGHKTFNSFELCDGCVESNPFWIVATLIGPLFTFGLMWWGWYQLRQPGSRSKQMGFALIFANFPINRIVFALMGFNDEQYATSVLFGSDNSLAFWITNLIVWFFTFPPLYSAYRAIDHKYRFWWFLGYLILPFVFVVVFAGLFLEEWLLLEQQFLSRAVIGIPLLILIVEVISLLGYSLFRNNLHLSSLVNLR